MDEALTKSFYDKFLEQRMVSYFLYGNKRIDAAVAFIRPRLGEDCRTILDFGCGIGAVANSLARAHPTRRVLGVDASKKNIQFAQAAFASPHAIFREHSDLSIATLSVLVREVLGVATVDAIVLVDVIEHIPADKRFELLVNLRSLVTDDGEIFITYPTPEYQRYLRENDSSSLQFIDEDIEADQLLLELRRAGWHVRQLRAVDVWLKNQYFHLLGRASRPLRQLPAKAGFVQAIRRTVKQKLIVPFRRRRLKMIRRKISDNESFGT